MKLTWDDIENLRDQTFFRTPTMQLKDMDEAEQFVNATGFCFAFKMQKSELPCMWHAAAGERNPQYPKHVQHDPFIGLVWTAKDELVAQKKVYYGKALKKRPTFMSLDFFPAFYLLQKRQNGAEDYVADYMRGSLSAAAKKIMDALLEHSPMVTADLKLASTMAQPDKRGEFDNAMAELQSKMYVAKIAEFYDPFTFLWDLVERRFENELEITKQMDERTARQNILQRYFDNVWVSKPLLIKRVFGWMPDEINNTLQDLLDREILTDDISIDGEKKPFYGVKQLK